MKAVTLICGIPNAGKTTYSRKFDNVIHHDSLLLTTQERYRYTIEKAKQSEDICIDGMYGEKKRRVELLDALKDYTKTCIWMDTPVEKCIKRENRRRPDHLILHYAKTFEPPTFDEGWDEIIVIGDGNGKYSKSIENA